MAVKKPKSKVIDRKAQKKDWLNQFFDSKTLKLIGLSWVFVVILIIFCAICILLNNTHFADKVWDLTETLIKLTFGAMFSAVGIKVESTI